MRKTTILTAFIRELSYLVDKGKSISLSEFKKHVLDKNVLEWLENSFPTSKENTFDLSFFNQQSYKKYLHDELYNIVISYNCGPAWQIKNNGLCSLISITTIMMEEAINGNNKIE